MGDRNKGLIGKYDVRRVDGRPVGDCIVLPLDDPNSWSALLEWANAVEQEGYFQLADEVREKVGQNMLSYQRG